jgi:hypothetical protein
VCLVCLCYFSWILNLWIIARLTLQAWLY